MVSEVPRVLLVDDDAVILRLLEVNFRLEGFAVDTAGRGEQAIAEYREAVRLGPTSALFMNDLAWALATNPDEKMRDIKEAVRLAEESINTADSSKRGRATSLLVRARAIAAARRPITNRQAAGRNIPAS